MSKTDGNNLKNRLLHTSTLLVIASTLVSGDYASSIQKPIKDVLCAIWDALISIGIAAAGLVIVVSGVNYAYNRDDPAQRKASMSWVIHAVIGLIILSIAKAVVESTGITVSCNVT